MRGRNGISNLTHANRISLSATLIVAAGVAAVWIAAGSSGMLAHSLRHVLTCLVLGIAIVAGWPAQTKEWKDWVIFAGGIVIALGMAVFPLEVVNILAVIIILSTLAHFRGGLDGRAIFVAALAVLCFALCHFILTAFPRFWTVGDHLGQALGWSAGKMTGQPLSVGATFGGVDFLLLMFFLYGFWLNNTASPRFRRALFGGLAILTTQFLYLAVLAYSEKLLTVMPVPIYPVEDDYMRMGAWVWQNALRSMIPWSLPAIAVLLQTLVVALMVRSVNWRAAPPVPTENPRATPAKSNVKPVAIKKKAELNVFFQYGLPVAAAMLLAALSSLWTFKPELSGKTIVAYRSDEVSWTTPKSGEHGENGFGLLPDYVQSLGGTFVFSRELAEEVLSQADVVLLIKPDANFSKEHKTRLEAFVARGGSLLVATDRNASVDSQKKIAELLEPVGIRAERDIAVSRTESWEQSLRVMNHPATLGIDDCRDGFGPDSCVSLAVGKTASPLLMGRWGCAHSGNAARNEMISDYRAGERLGDLVLIAESSDRSDSGKIIVLGNATCLSNDLLPVSYEFVGRLLGYLAQKRPAFPLWRMIGGMILGVLLFCFLYGAMRKPSQPAAAALAFAAALIFCRIVTLDCQRVVPGESEKSSKRLALIDASNLEAYSDQLRHPLPTVKEFSGSIWFDQGLGNFARTLASNGYLPLRMKKFSPEQLERASLLISIAPGRSYSAEEIGALRNFVSGGGTLLCIAGAEESRAINPLLKEFSLRVPHSPVSPRESVPEPEPNGSMPISYTKPEDEKEDTVHFFAAWNVESLAIGSEGEEVLPQIFKVENGREKWLMVFRNVGNQGGRIAVIADTYFAANENPDPMLKAEERNERFWRWFLPRIVDPEKTRKSNSPADSPANLPAEGGPMQESGPDEG